jgi:hypothetical protein
MTTRANDEGLRRSDPVYSYEDRPPTLTTAEMNWGDLEQRFDAHTEAVGEVLGETRASFEKRIKELELQVATMRGALDVLRDGALDVLRDKGASSTDNVNETIDKIRTDFQEKVKEIELRLAETIGTVDVLRGKGVPGALHVRGTFDSGATYCLNDVVASGGSSWVALKDSPGTIPGPGWQLIASQGKRGVKGERGERGAAAAPLKWIGAGLNFRNGVTLETRLSDGSVGAPVQLFKTISVDPEDFTLKFVGCDDSVLRISLLPLFEAYHRQTTG